MTHTRVRHCRLTCMCFFFLLGLCSLFLSATNVHWIVFLTASGMCGWTMLSCQSWIASHLFPPHRSSSSGPHTCGRVCTFLLFFSMGVCVFICCTSLTKDVECKRLHQPVELVFFCHSFYTQLTHHLMSLPQASLSARPQWWQPLLSGRKEQRRTHSKRKLLYHNTVSPLFLKIVLVPFLRSRKTCPLPRVYMSYSNNAASLQGCSSATFCPTGIYGSLMFIQ